MINLIHETSIAEQKTVNDKVFPLVLSPENDKSSVSEELFVNWLKENKQALRTKLQDHGAILFRNCPVDTPDAFEKMLDVSGVCKYALSVALLLENK